MNFEWFYLSINQIIKLARIVLKLYKKFIKWEIYCPSSIACKQFIDSCLYNTTPLIYSWS
jgi:uncharacterized membrane protein